MLLDSLKVHGQEFDSLKGELDLLEVETFEIEDFADLDLNAADGCCSCCSCTSTSSCSSCSDMNG